MNRDLESIQISRGRRNPRNGDEDEHIPTVKKHFRESVMGLCIIGLSIPAFGASHRIDGNLVLVPEDKLPPQARVQGDAMTLYLKDLHTLYLYIEEDHGRNLAIFDVRNPARIKFRKLVSINAPAPFDFEQLIAPHTILIRYRDGSGEAILNLSDAKKPLLQLTSDKPTETYIIPVSNERAKQTGEAVQDTATPRDYQIVAPNSQAPLITINLLFSNRMMWEMKQRISWERPA